MAEREDGLYWVKWFGIDRWSVARWSCYASHWTTLGDDTAHIDEDFAEIGERAEREPPQPITSAQKTGGRFQVWICSEHLSPGAAGWYTAFWDARIDAWCVLTPFFHTQGISADRVTHYLPLPPDMKP